MAVTSINPYNTMPNSFASISASQNRARIETLIGRQISIMEQDPKGSPPPPALRDIAEAQSLLDGNSTPKLYA